MYFPWLPEIPVTSNSSLCFPWSHKDFWIQLEKTSLFGMIYLPQTSSLLSPPDSNCFLGPGLFKESELEQSHSNLYMFSNSSIGFSSEAHGIISGHVHDTQPADHGTRVTLYTVNISGHLSQQSQRPRCPTVFAIGLRYI